MDDPSAAVEMIQSMPGTDAGVLFANLFQGGAVVAEITATLRSGRIVVAVFEAFPSDQLDIADDRSAQQVRSPNVALSTGVPVSNGGGRVN